MCDAVRQDTDADYAGSPAGPCGLLGKAGKELPPQPILPALWWVESMTGRQPSYCVYRVG